MKFINLNNFNKGLDKLKSQRNFPYTIIDNFFNEKIAKKLEKEFPGFQARIYDENKQLRTFVNIYVNGEDIRFLDGLNSNTKSGDEVSIVPAVAGGN